MIVRRYLTREILVTLAALTSILMLIFLSNQFVHYLARSADGSFPGMVVLKLMMLEVPNLLGLLLPLGLYMAILVAYGRLYAESEMIVLYACGYTQKKLIMNTMILATIVALITGALMIWASPIIARDRQQLIKGGGVLALIQAVIPQRFEVLNQGKRVFYVTQMSRDRTQAEGIFLVQREEEVQKNGASQWRIVWADRGFSQDDADEQSFVVLEKGQQYKGAPGTTKIEAVSFAQYKVRVPQTDDSAYRHDMRTIPSSQLLPVHNEDPAKAAEIQWRLSVPLMAFVLALLAIPLSKVDPRRGKYAKMLPAIILYVLYANGMFIARNWVVTKQVPVWIGLWWIHAIFLLLALFLLRRTK